MGKNSAEPSPQEDPQLTKPEMFENPLYGSVSSFPKLLPRKEQESPKMLRKEPPPCPDPGMLSPSILLPKAQEAEGTKGTGKPAPAPAPFLSPTPRLRSFTCSSSAESRPAGGDKSQGKAKAPASSQAPVPAKRPIKPSRSELSQQTPPAPAQRPPLPVKSPAVLHLQHSKGRDYRENAELPHHGKHRPEDAPLGRAAMQVRGEGACTHARETAAVPGGVPREGVGVWVCPRPHPGPSVPAGVPRGACARAQGGLCMPVVRQQAPVQISEFEPRPPVPAPTLKGLNKALGTNSLSPPVSDLQELRLHKHKDPGSFIFHCHHH